MSPELPPRAFDRISDGIIGFDRQWRYTFVNESALKLIKLRADQVMGRVVWEVFPNAYGGSFYEAGKRALQTGEVTFVEDYNQEIEIWFESRIYPSENGLTVFFHDITERKRAEGLLHGQSRVLELIATGAPLAQSLDALLRLIEEHCPGMHGSILLLDREGRRLRHGAAPSLPGSFTGPIDGSSIGPAHGSCGTAAFRGEPVIARDIATDAKWAPWRDLALCHGLRACWSNPIFDDQGRVLGTYAMYYREAGEPQRRDQRVVDMVTHIAAIAINSDNTKREREEQERVRRENRELEQANRAMREASRLKSEFVANMSHELRTPLNAIIGFSEYLVDGHAGVLPDRQAECVQHVLVSGRHLLQLVSDVLDLAKIEAGKLELTPQEFRLDDAFEEVLSVVGWMASSKGVALDVQRDPALEWVVLDQQKFKQVLYNLVANAVKFTERGGSVHVKAQGMGPEQFCVSVRDTGIGIRAEDLGKLFREFQQLDSGATRRHEGTGLGLALSKRLVESQQGRIGVESEHGVGSTFYFVLPRELRARFSDHCP